ncbi:hypothetical protein CL629_00770 [bacterium]|nr:hypothetical protein [bacterium]
MKNFSFLLLQNMVRADVFTGSLAVFRFAAKPLVFSGGFLAAAGGEMRSNYFKNGAPRGIDFSYVVLGRGLEPPRIDYYK